MSKTSGGQAPQKSGGVDRRSLFKLGGVAVAAAAVVPLAGEAKAAESDADKKKARYKETEHVKNFYRVNRY